MARLTHIRILASLLALLCVAAAPAFTQHAVSPQDHARLVKADELIAEAVNLLHANQDREAAEKLNQALQLAPEIPVAHYDLALALAKLGRLPEAIEQAKTAISLKADEDAYWLTLGGMYQASGQLELALGIYREFQTRFPNSPQAPKLASLAKGLEGELRRQASSAARAGSDYFSEVTAQGTHRWPDARMPVKVFIPPGNGIPGYEPWMEAVLKQAFIDWSTATRGKLSFAFVMSPAEANIQCSWVSDPAVLANPAEAGEAQIYVSKSGIVKGTVKLLTVPSSPNLPQTENRFRIVCLHEVGHAIGLQGHSTNANDIMHAATSTISDHWRDLSARDNATIVRLYSK